MPRKPGHRQGVSRYRRPGQIALDVAPTLRTRVACVVCDDRGCMYCPKVTRRMLNEEREEERDAFAKAIAASNISNAEFHRALAEFDREWEEKK